MAAVRRDCHTYLQFYCNRFRNLPLDINGERLSRVNQNYVAYARTFLEAAGIPETELWKLLMKTNAYGVHAPNEEALQGIALPYPLIELGSELIHKCRPRYIVGIGRAADKAIQALRHGMENEPTTEFYSFRSCPNWRRSPDCTALIRRLGKQWCQEGGTLEASY